MPFLAHDPSVIPAIGEVGIFKPLLETRKLRFTEMKNFPWGQIDIRHGEDSEARCFHGAVSHEPCIFSVDRRRLPLWEGHELKVSKWCGIFRGCVCLYFIWDWAALKFYCVYKSCRHPVKMQILTRKAGGTRSGAWNPHWLLGAAAALWTLWVARR